MMGSARYTERHGTSGTADGRPPKRTRRWCVFLPFGTRRPFGPRNRRIGSMADSQQTIDWDAIRRAANDSSMLLGFWCVSSSCPKAVNTMRIGLLHTERQSTGGVRHSDLRWRFFNPALIVHPVIQSGIRQCSMLWLWQQRVGATAQTSNTVRLAGTCA